MSDNFIIKGSQNSLDFPNFDDPPQLIRPLYELVSNPKEFCERMGFPVNDKTESTCYNGVPTAQTLHLKKKSSWAEMFNYPTNK
jgi:hypothetical protein